MVHWSSRVDGMWSTLKMNSMVRLWIRADLSTPNQDGWILLSLIFGSKSLSSGLQHYHNQSPVRTFMNIPSRLSSFPTASFATWMNISTTSVWKKRTPSTMQKPLSTRLLSSPRQLRISGREWLGEYSGPTGQLSPDCLPESIMDWIGNGKLPWFQSMYICIYWHKPKDDFL